MRLSNFVKRRNLFFTLLLAPILFVFCCAAFLGCRDGYGVNMKYDHAIEIAKKEFGCDKIKWATSYALSESLDSFVLIQSNDRSGEHMQSPFAFYIVAEKDGEEIYIVVPCETDLEKPFLTTWSLDYSFSQIVDKFNDLGAQYIAEVPDDYYSLSGEYIDIVTEKKSLSKCARYYGVDESDGSFYDSLDIKAAFVYKRTENKTTYDFMVAQINGELRSYKRETALS